MRAGMTVAQIRAAQPAARVPRVRGTLHNMVNERVAICELEIRGSELAGQVFDTCFYLYAGRLVQVMMTARRASRALAGTLAAHLRSRHGAELAEGRDPCPPAELLTVCEWDWRVAGGAEVNITYADVEGEGAVLNINYRPSFP
ncbi:MAG TPA: hypothetical protein VMS43_10245 [Allosphingosinicella sp.]|nr:hypothetical protein [Allosphingosinicella sp.]